MSAGCAGLGGARRRHALERVARVTGKGPTAT